MRSASQKEMNHIYTPKPSLSGFDKIRTVTSRQNSELTQFHSLSQKINDKNAQNTTTQHPHYFTVVLLWFHTQDKAFSSTITVHLQMCYIVWIVLNFFLVTIADKP